MKVLLNHTVSLFLRVFVISNLRYNCSVRCLFSYRYGARVKKGNNLRNRKDVHCFCRVIETRVKVWSVKMLWEQNVCITYRQNITFLSQNSHVIKTKQYPKGNIAFSVTFI